LGTFKEVDEDLEAVTWELESLRRVEVEVQLREWSVERCYASLRDMEGKETTAENVCDELSERVTRLEDEVRAKKAELGVERRWLAVQEDRVASLESALADLRERETEVEWKIMEKEIGELRL
jgi:chromosome segregation ATPase